MPPHPSVAGARRRPEARDRRGSVADSHRVHRHRAERGHHEQSGRPGHDGSAPRSHPRDDRVVGPDRGGAAVEYRIEPEGGGAGDREYPYWPRPALGPHLLKEREEPYPVGQRVAERLAENAEPDSQKERLMNQEAAGGEEPADGQYHHRDSRVTAELVPVAVDRHLPGERWKCEVTRHEDADRFREADEGHPVLEGARPVLVE